MFKMASVWIIVGLSSTAALAQEPARMPSQVKVLPCPAQAWQFEDPSFDALPGARAFFGRYDGGLYRVEIPNNWNGGLLLWAHGTQGNTGPNGSILRVPVAPGASAGGSLKWRQHLIDSGFAWAASSFRCNGVVSGVGLLDTLALTDVFKTVNLGRSPSRIYLAGRSQGGLTTVEGLRYFPGTFAGGLAMCTPNGSDFYTAVRGAAEFISGLSVDDTDSQQLSNAMAGALGRPPEYTAKGRQLASVQIRLSGGPRPFAVEGLAARFLQNVSGLPSAPHMSVGTNIGVEYAIDESLGLTATALNKGARRMAADQSLRGPEGPYIDLKPFDGRIEQPLLTLHGTGDLQVPISVERVIRAAVAEQGRERLLVQRIMRIPGHCGFSDAEQIRAFDDLVAWVEKGIGPEGDDVFQDLRDAGRKVHQSASSRRSWDIGYQ